MTYAGLGTAGGVAHAQAYGSAANFCNVVSWSTSGADEVVSIACYNSGTSPVDTQFVANFAVGHQSTAHFSYLWLDEPTASGKHKVSATYRYDSTGHEPTVQRLSAGKYRVFLPASYDEKTSRTRSRSPPMGRPPSGASCPRPSSARVPTTSCVPTRRVRRMTPSSC